MIPGNIVKTFTSKKGNSVIIRYLAKNDLYDLLNFVNNLIVEDTFVQLSGVSITLKEEKKYLDESLAAIKNGKKIHLVVTVDGRFAGSAEIRRFDRRKSHVGEIGISLAREFRQEGIGSILLQTLIDEGRAAGLKLLIIHCFENNKLAGHVYEKLGFVRAGIVPGVYAYRGNYIGEMVFYLPL